jgi:hypothetical protein
VEFKWIAGLRIYINADNFKAGTVIAHAGTACSTKQVEKLHL